MESANTVDVNNIDYMSDINIINKRPKSAGIYPFPQEKWPLMILLKKLQTRIFYTQVLPLFYPQGFENLGFTKAMTCR
jgi:hypothetical protein